MELPGDEEFHKYTGLRLEERFLKAYLAIRSILVIKFDVSQPRKASQLEQPMYPSSTRSISVQRSRFQLHSDIQRSFDSGLLSFGTGYMIGQPSLLA